MAAYGMKALEPGNLYMTISIAHQPPGWEPDLKHEITDYIPKLPDPLDPSFLEELVQTARVQEQFIWGLYYHRDLRDGTTYTLRRIDLDSLPKNAIPGVTKPMFELQRRDVQESPRLDFGIVGLVRLLQVPPTITNDLTAYLDYIAPMVSMQSQRTFMWASSVYFGTRRHVLDLQRKNNMLESRSGLLKECMVFAYGEIWYALGRQLPRPILSSTWGYAPFLGQTAESWERTSRIGDGRRIQSFRRPRGGRPDQRVPRRAPVGTEQAI
ncbi:hypothetical protein B0T10DRAFT_148181 [Thelonectria olida]|uniref:Uncharacterized protein n=1 Tax=Thelonectria olida TaxID=1576542 RepID=A0A9P8VVP0_9HYPO|nr:hypothetical protein B0T10DRAFT_148181 [Thelonectria olida]